MPARESPGANTRALTIVAFSATAGAFVEFHDFFIYGYAAASAFPAIFFLKLPPAQAPALSYLAFGAGFPARLVGAFIGCSEQEHRVGDSLADPHTLRRGYLLQSVRILGGMIAPWLLAGLIGENVSIGGTSFLSFRHFIVVVATLALLFIRETRDVNLSALDQAEAGLPITLRPREAGRIN